MGHSMWSDPSMLSQNSGPMLTGLHPKAAGGWVGEDPQSKHNNTCSKWVHIK